MRHLHFTVTLLEDVIFSEKTASTGSHATLDHLPGAAFLGYCAGKLYAPLKDEAYTVFHSGQVRFNNAYPLTECDNPTIPVPLCWHLAKGKSIDFHGDQLVNLIHTTDQTFDQWEKGGIQQKQIRTGFFAENNNYLTPDRRFCLKTAIDRKKLGRSADSQLFGYESLVAGSRWYFCIDLDSTVSSSIDEKICSVFADKTFCIGHSRTAEYGLVKVEMVENGSVSFEAGSSDCNVLLVYALSDLALRNTQTGVPTLIPESKHFSLPDDATFLPEKSYLRNRYYAPFNSYRRSFDLERQVIAKGSVLAFRRNESFTDTELTACRTVVAGGVGSYRYDGLGKVLVQPKFLDKDYPATLARLKSKEVRAAANSQGTILLKGWLCAKTQQLAEEQQAIATVALWIEALVDKNLSKEELPNNAQWGQLRNIALNVTDETSLCETLFHSDSNDPSQSIGFCYHGVSEKQWKKTFIFNNQRISYRDFLETEVIGTVTNFATTCSRLYLLANRLPRRVNQLIHKEEK